VTLVPTLRDAGECALVAEFGDRIDPEVADGVLAFDRAVRAAELPGLRETVPTYRSLMLHYDPGVVSRAELAEALGAIDPEAVAATPPKRWRVPVCLDREHAEDLGLVCEALGIGLDEAVAALLGSELRLTMYGFAPGFAYLGGLDRRLAIPRRATPRPRMPAGSLLIAGGQASLASVAMPTGWYVVGRTPVAMFDPDGRPMVPFEVGDRLQLEPVDAAAFERLAKEGARPEPEDDMGPGSRPGSSPGCGRDEDQKQISLIPDRRAVGGAEPGPTPDRKPRA